MKEFPKVLVFSNNCFSKSDSNGRTLGNFFVGWPKDKLAQFYIQSADPDFGYCSNYYRVTDSQALRSIYSTGRGGRVKPKREGEITLSNTMYSSIKSRKRNASTMLARDVVWSLKRWMNKDYKKWVMDFCPEIVLLQAGDCPFMFELAIKTAKTYNAKLVIYNTEGYYFKDFDYFRNTSIAHMIYPLFYRRLRSIIKRAYNQADYAIFNCTSLYDDFVREFAIPAEIIYTASELTNGNKEKKKVTNQFVVSYAGNLGVGRHRSLIEIANALQEIGQNYYLDIYGTIPNESIRKAFNDCKGIRFHGRIDYNQVQAVTRNSDLLIHVESFEAYYRKDLKYAFSTKIADCLASNRCFLIYAPTDYAETQYLIQNDAAYIVTTNEKLVETLKQLIEDPDSRDKYLERALMLSNRNHDQENSVRKFQKILCSLI